MAMGPNDRLWCFDAVYCGDCGSYDADGESIGGCRSIFRVTNGRNQSLCIRKVIRWSYSNPSSDSDVAESRVY